ncbi:MAG: arginine--tRNA ligase [Candidatus Heimdallarchaeota archaeon]
MSILKIELMKLLKHALKCFDGLTISDPDILKSLNTPPDSNFGDFSSNIGFRLAKHLKMPVNEVVVQIAQHLPPSPLVKTVQPFRGYVNFYLSKENAGNFILTRVFDEEKAYGNVPLGQGQKLVLEHTAVNPIKPLHIGHLRNSVLGDTMARIYRACGWEVEVQNLINDAGRQVATVGWALHKGLQARIPRPKHMKFDLWLGLIYTQAVNLLKKQPKLEQEIDAWMVEVTQSQDLLTLRRILNEKCVESNLETTWRAGITYDLLIWESDISSSGLWETTLETLEKNDNFSWEETGENAGCFMAHLSHLPEYAGERSADKVLIRSNKVPTYTAHDLALQMWKFGMLDQVQLKYQLWVAQFDGKHMWSTTPFEGFHTVERHPTPPRFAHGERVINVIGSEQDYLQSILKVTMKLTGHFDKYENSIHMSYKHVTLPGERISGREDEWIKARAWADAVIDDAVARAYDYLLEKRPELPESRKKEIAEKVGIATVRYWLCKFSTDQEISFEIGQASSLEGDTGPYILYSYVRAAKILMKAEERGYKPIRPKNYSILEENGEFELIKSLSQLPEIVQTVAESLKPNLLTTYANDLATKFNKFYERFPVLTAKNEAILELRLAIVSAYKQVMQNVLNLLGIPILEEM